MKCYFCQNELEQDPDTSPGPFKSIRSKSCDYCTSTHGIHHVSFIYHKDGSYMYAHIYLDEVKYTRVGATNFFNRGISIPLNTTYHIRLNMDNKTTSILEYGTTKDLLTLPTLNITPANVREKTKLYLLFS
jgi:hypothetical protein